MVVARRADLSLGLGLAEVAASPHTWLGLGRRDVGPLQLVVVRGDRGTNSVMRQRGPAWGAGFAFPSARTVIIRADAGDPYRILRHELAHLALHDSIRVRVPLWFQEGYAALAAGELERLDALRLNLSVARGNIPGFFELDRGLREAEPTARVAYSLAASAVALLARRHPDHTLAALFSRLGAGESFDSAVLATTGSNLGRFEVEWQRDVRRRYGILGWVMAGGLWVIVALLLIVAVSVRRRRDRPRRMALDQGWTVEPDPDEGPAEEPERPLDEARKGP